MTDDPNQLLSPADAARQIGLTPAAIVAMANRGELPCVRTAGGRRLFRQQDVTRAAQRRIHPSTGPAVESR